MAKFLQIKRGVPFNVELGIVEQTITLTNENILNKKIVLNFIPEFPERIKLTPAGGPQQVYGIDYIIINRNELSWDGFGLDGFLEPEEIIFLNYFA